MSTPDFPSEVPSEIPPERTSGKRLYFFGLAIEAALGLLALLIAWPLGLPLRDWLRPDLALLGLGLAAFLPLLLGYLVLERISWRPFRRVRQIVRIFAEIMLQNVSLAGIALLCIAAGVGEELLFRGLIQGGITQFMAYRAPMPMGAAPWIGGILVASVLFAAAHAVTRTYSVLVFFLSIFFGLVFYLSGSLVPVIIAHALYDFFVFVYIRQRFAKETAVHSTTTGRGS